MFHIFAGFLLGFFRRCFCKQRRRKAPASGSTFPMLKQTEDGCGSAAIAMLLQYWNAHGTSVAASQADAAAIRNSFIRERHEAYSRRIWNNISGSGIS